MNVNLKLVFVLGLSCVISVTQGQDAAPASASPAEAGHQHPTTAPGGTGAAVAVLTPCGESGVHGVVRFTEEGDSVKIEGTIEGLKPGPHGFHVHEFGDISVAKDGSSAGSHYNPTQSAHGDVTAADRHVGDLGNLTADDKGVATVNLTDKIIKLDGPTGIVGHGLVVHADPDKFTQPTGDAGGRVAFAVIGWAKKAEAK